MPGDLPPFPKVNPSQLWHLLAPDSLLQLQPLPLSTMMGWQNPDQELQVIVSCHGRLKTNPASVLRLWAISLALCCYSQITSFCFPCEALL